MKQLLISLLFISIGVFLIVEVVRRVGGAKIIAALDTFPLWAFAVIILFTLGSFTAGILRWYNILRAQEIIVPAGGVFRTWFAAYAFSYLTPVVFIGGEIIKGFIFNDRHRIPWRKTLASVAIDKILDGVGWVVFVLLGVILFVFQIGLPLITKSLIGGSLVFLLFASVVGLVYFRSFRRERIAKPLLRKFALEKSSLGGFLEEVENDVFSFIKPHKPEFWRGLFLTAGKHALNWARNFLVIFFLGKGTQIALATIATGVSYIAYSVPIPAALGAYEALESVTFAQMQTGAEFGAAFTLIIRAAELLFVLWGGFVLLRLGVGLIAWRIIRRLGVENMLE